MTLSSRGLGHHPFTVSTGVRIPVGSPSFVALGFVVSVKLVLQSKSFKLPGVVVQLVRIPACHAGGRGFESRPLRQYVSKHAPSGAFFVSTDQFTRHQILVASGVDSDPVTRTVGVGANTPPLRTTNGVLDQVRCSISSPISHIFFSSNCVMRSTCAW